MRVCGIIAEYDPFHKGHLYQLDQAREKTRADYMVCVLGCAFSQRGEAMLFQTHDRATMALANGFDLVLGMPFSFSCAQANRFARGGVGILQGISAVTHHRFGCETDHLDWLTSGAQLLNRPSIPFIQSLKRGLSQGRSFAQAQGQALAEHLPELPKQLLSSPNFILGLSYLRELEHLKSHITALPVRRETDYHSPIPGPMASASAVRALLERGKTDEALQACPDKSREVIREAMAAGRYHRAEALDKALIACLISGGNRLAGSPEISEGLDSRIHAAAMRARSREELISLAKTKRYPRARINRALSHALVGGFDFPGIPPYARLLGLRRSAGPLLKKLDDAFPLVGRPAKSGFPGIKQDMLAEELWALGSGLAPESAWRYQIAVID
jgi:predicted nucleotidyltransferase